MSVGTYPPADTSLTIPLAISNGGTGAITAANARTNLGLGTMATQNANAVAITDGSIALGGAGAGLAQLSVRSALAASDDSTLWTALRVYPHVGSASATAVALRIETPVASGAGSLVNDIGIQILPRAAASSSAIGLQIIDPGAAGVVHGIESHVAAGTNRYNIYAQGTAPNYFAAPIGINTLPSGIYHLNILHNRTGGFHGVNIQSQGNDTTGYACIFNNVAGTSVGTILVTATATAYNTSSDVRLKHSISTLTNVLSILESLRPVHFHWNADNSEGVGFLAHELQQVIPAAVTGEPGTLNDDGTIRPQQADYSKLVPWIIAGMQELVLQVRALHAIKI